MNSNLLNKSIIIEKETTSTNSLGTPIETYTFLKESYAGTKLINGGTQYGDGLKPFTTIEFLVRYDSEINYKCRIKMDEQYYKIVHIYTLGRQDWTKIECKVWEE